MRPISGREEIELFNRLPYVTNDELAGDLEVGRRRPEWMWVALHGDRLVARVAWWASGAGADPQFLDVFDFDDISAGTQLVKAAMEKVLPPQGKPPQYLRFIPPDWREDPGARRVVADRMAVLERTGARLFVERLRLQWTRGTPTPEPVGRLEFRPMRDRLELVGLMTRVLEGTLDAHSRDDLTRMPPERVAAEQFDNEFLSYGTPTDWWRIATLPGGEPVGFVVPARNNYNAIIAYIGVLPEHRGHRYIDDILGEGTRILARQDVSRIRASTDVGNVPMANAFERAGYVNFERQIDMVWPDAESSDDSALEGPREH
jgi:RimJ/RimL family protein N-acetyltransferase